MKRPPFEVADIIRRSGRRFVDRYRDSLTWPQVKVLKAIPDLEEKNVVRGQFRGYRKEGGVAPDSHTETFAAVKLEVNSWRWQGPT